MTTTFAVLGIGGWEVVLILAVVLILFGARKLPELAKGLGQGIKEFKKATRDVSEEMNRAMNDDYNPPAAPRQIDPPADKTVENKPVTVAQAATEPKAK